jgi:hypothetical protein
MQVQACAGTQHVSRGTLFDHDLFRKPASTRRIKSEGVLFGIMLKRTVTATQS